MAAVPAPRVCGGSTRRVDDFGLFSGLPQSHIAVMAKTPEVPKKSKTPKSKAPKSKAHRPDVQPIAPALAELLNPAINRGDAGMGSGTGLQPPPDNSWDRRAGGEAAAHRARASTKGTGEDVAKRDVLLLRPEVWKRPPRPITARRRPSPRSTPNSRANSACPRRKTTTRRWPGRRAARWKRSASRPPPMRWRI